MTAFKAHNLINYMEALKCGPFWLALMERHGRLVRDI